jgi:protein O-GlcNAc transferase
MNTDKIIQSALELHQAGNLQKAEVLYREILKKQPDNFDALHMLGVLYSQLGKDELSVKYLRQAIRFRPGSSTALYNLGNVLKKTGQNKEALSCLEESVRLNPDFYHAYFLLGELYQKDNNNDSAKLCYQKALRSNRKSAEAYSNLGDIYLREGHMNEAITHYQKALELDPNLYAASNNMGIALKKIGRVEEAIPYYQKALEVNPEAENAYQNLGNAYRELGRSEEAKDAFNMALSVSPDNIKARWAKCISQIPVIYPESEQIEISRNNYTQELLNLKDAILLETPQDIRTAAEAVGSQQPYYLAYQGMNDCGLQKTYGDLVHSIMSLRYPEFARRPVTPSISPKDPMRVGVISGLFYNHTVWKLFRGWFENLNSSRFRLYGYHTGTLKDNMTESARQTFSHFVEDKDSFEDLCRIIKNDNLHALIYPEIGMDPIIARLAALRFAPVQCVTWGHPETTGLPTIDYFLSSELMEPPDADSHYTETLVRLPNISLYYTPLDIPLANMTRDTFGLPHQSVLYLCCQSLFKYLPLYDEVFPGIARVVGDCRFLFISHQSRFITEQFQGRLKKAFSRSGMNADDHLVFLPRLNTEQYFMINRLSDVYLDSIGWSGGNTTLEALECNLPVVTFPGHFMRGRHSAAILTMMGLTETIASTPEEYVALAGRFGQDSAFRQGISEKIAGKKQLLYRDRTCITALEDFLERVAKEALDKRIRL